MPSPHPYGPHRPEDAPNAVSVLSGGASQGRPVITEVRQLPAALVRQREQLNTLAHEAAQR